MKMWNNNAVRLLVVLLALMAVGSGTASAQIDTGILVGAGAVKLHQDGKVVGIMYVPQHMAGKLHAEHVVLFVNYRVSTDRNPVRTEFVPAPELQYASEEDFFAKVPFAPGDKYSYSTKTEYTSLPNR